MRNDLSPGELLGAQFDHGMRYEPPIAEHVRGHRGGCDGPVSVMYVVDIREVRYDGQAADIGDVDQAQVIYADVIPGKEWFAGS
jgi:hypothetical protein